MHTVLTRRMRIIIISFALALGVFTAACAVEGGAPGREVCYGDCK